MKRERNGDDEQATPEDRPKIRQLDPTTVDRIAAGEVVERPASAVKELVENSLDADASRIAVEVDAGGADRIRVADDGIGMTREELERAVEKHTTSKIRDIEDLEAGVETLGFRGEALYTIGAVSRISVTTRPRGDSGAGTTLRMEGGEVVDVGPAGCPEGTAIEVTDLFYNTPARRNYLKREATEFDHVNTVVTQYALANPDVAVSLEHDGREVFATTGQGDLQATILSVYGREVATGMVAVGESDWSGPLSGLRGYVSDPETTRSAPTYVSTYVNGRYVRSAAIRKAIIDAYGSQLAPDRYPFAVLFLSVPPDSVDVNVHPRKMEVRFSDEDAICSQVREGIERTLLENGLIRSSAPRGRSAPAQTEVAPDFEGDGAGSGSEADPSSAEEGSSDTADTDGSVGHRTSSQDRSGSQDRLGSQDRSGSGDRSTRATAGSETARVDPTSTRESDRDTATDRNTQPTEVESGSADASRRSKTADEHSVSPTAPKGRLESESGNRTTRSTGYDEESQTTEMEVARASSPDERRFSGPVEQRTLDGDAVADPSFDRLPPLRVLGQLEETYVVAKSAEGLVLIDQHAADERVNYERLRERFEGDVTTQSLVEPVEIELTAREAALFDSCRDALAQLGFTGGLEDDRTAVITTIPAIVGDTADPALLRDVLTSIVRSGDGNEPVEAIADAMIADLACYPSITGNTSLTEGSVFDLLTTLDDCENPYACPHGRPTIVEIDRAEIADRFERDYPGHAGRRES